MQIIKKINLQEKLPLKWLALFNVALGTLMATLSAGVTNTALPLIAEDFSVNINMVQWVVSAYFLVIVSLLPIFGKLADLTGRRKVYRAGLLTYAIGSALCGFSTSIIMLIFFRVFQAIGASMMMSNTLAIITSIFPGNERGRALGISNTVVAVGTLTGPAIGGLLIEFFGWHSVFFFVVPLGLFAFVISHYILPELKGAEEDKNKFDTAGAVLFALTMLLFILGVNNGNKYAWNGYIIAAIVFSGFLFGLFIINEKKHSSPLVDLSLFKNRMLVCGILAGFFSFASLLSINFMMPFYLNEILALSPSQLGMMLTAMPLAMGITAPFAGRISDKIPPVYITTGGLAVSLVGQFSLLGLGMYSTNLDVYLRMLLIGVGRGLFQAPNNSSIMGSVDKTKFGVVGSLISLNRNVASVLGIALTAMLFENVRAIKLATHGTVTVLIRDKIFMESFQVVMGVSCLLVILGIIASALRR